MSDVHLAAIKLLILLIIKVKSAQWKIGQIYMKNSTNIQCCKYEKKKKKTFTLKKMKIKLKWIY